MGKPMPADAKTAALYVTRNLGRECAPSTIRRWASAGILTAIGRDGKRKLYDLLKVHEFVTGEQLGPAS